MGMINNIRSMLQSIMLKALQGVESGCFRVKRLGFDVPYRSEGDVGPDGEAQARDQCFGEDSQMCASWGLPAGGQDVLKEGRGTEFGTIGDSGFAQEQHHKTALSALVQVELQAEHVTIR